MELLDGNLTHFLEQSQQPLPFHIQVSLCHDIALALTYLHSNGIVHRDLSSNNILLIAGNRAKVTDFGMSKFANANPRMTPLTMCPGTMVYMSPEALNEPPVYTNKLDSFSHGVLAIQILTHQFPNTGWCTRTVPFPQSPTGGIEIPVLDIQCRKSHIDLIDPTHPLLPIATDCLSYNEEDRPLAQQLCHRLAALEESPLYGESKQQTHERRIPAEDNEREGRERQIRELQQQREEQTLELQNLRQQLDTLQNQLQAKDQQFQQLQHYHAQMVGEYQELHQHQSQMEMQYQQLQQHHAQMMREYQQLQGRHAELVEENQHKLSHGMKERDPEKQLRELNQQLETSEQLTAELQQKFLQRDEVVQSLQERIAAKDRRIQQLEQQEAISRAASGASIQLTNKEGGGEFGDRNKVKGEVKSINLIWRKSGKAPEDMRRGAAAVDGRMVYFNRCESSTVHAYHSPTRQWSSFPMCPQVGFSLAVVNGLLTAIGGRQARQATNTLLSITEEDRGRKWSKKFPSMPTKRWWTAAVCSLKSLIVAGGTTGGGTYKDNLATVEVMDTENLQWYSVSSLPHSFNWTSATICGDRLYLLGGNDINGKSKSLLTCSLPDLLPSCNPPSLGAHLKTALTLGDEDQVWQKVADVPLHGSTCITINEQLLAVGGEDARYNETDAVYRYNPANNIWEVISNMPTARCRCLVAVLPSSELMVVGGGTDSVEIASVV